ncbi:MAG: serine/threonine protein kinase, partial [Chloroflexota bacterium]|nr:serine/threonine protein kinase [Chloroflexota bacterium]
MSFCCMKQHINAPDKKWCGECGSVIAGTIIDDYTILSYIGQGSSGTIYLARQHSLNNRQVVIKILNARWSQGKVNRFRQEAALLASLSHPYILPVYAYGVVQAPNQEATSSYSPYLVFPYIEQGSLDEVLVRENRRSMPLKRVIPLIEEIADALEYAHSKGILHRDVKPANLLLLGSHVILADFGVASLIEADQTHLRASLAGTPSYMAPEVWRYAPGRYSDQYALAVTCFRLLTGRLPWQEQNTSTPRNWLYAHCFVEPMSVLKYCPDVTQGIDIVLKRALAKDPHDRYPSVMAFTADLRVAADETQVNILPAVTPYIYSITHQHAAIPHFSQKEEVIQSTADTKGLMENPIPTVEETASIGQLQTIGETNPLSDMTGGRGWIWKGFVLNALICTLLTA